jgi:hypothetical protein
MFQETELTRLQAQKDLLVLRSSVNRLQLAAEWQQLRSPQRWGEEAARLLQRHPVWTAALATAAGALAVKAVRNPGAVSGGLGRLGKLATLAFSVWKIMRR